MVKGKNGLEVINLEQPFVKSPKVCLSQMVNLNGTTLVKFSRSGLRPFNQEELKRILRVGFCLKCHQENDVIFKNWPPKKTCPYGSNF
ncbi:hypothetical protein F1847_01095 [Thermodesulfobacterium sp. TA1]|uniref:hypothetical protein n=1 Tax=Thermodesulfobacterium sp. TA1 TaxID=2234087 RepID=UPI0012328508|nr:hypothetical protein [Thermodesulfobacterium sp. TA1]QER41401.1 hypothetical protein F1847_01095 [Thermodesulfobacterium sp. TA1]